MQDSDCHSQQVLGLVQNQYAQALHITTTVLNYAAPSWQPRLSKTNMENLGRAQNKPFWIIAGQCRSAPVQALRIKAGVTSYATVSVRLTTIWLEKAPCFPDDHPRRLTLEKNVHQRLKRHSWRDTAQLVIASMAVSVSCQKLGGILEYWRHRIWICTWRGHVSHPRAYSWSCSLHRWLSDAQC